ncbi:E3 ubiquitin-protein ligase SH3RF1-like isoform X2 [Haliotis rubra]|uniref:E3 ubiquitin-protein ligase SH3RF1-like isoform X2 n=1 Tax=Haliotis rubra TaxID=36100 RepID=UPI001EE5E955|nr:E3 ubiquitin-protein ligase SH3RF1-like isoform X2 [Haliotis rubra]
MDEQALNELLECSVCLERLDHTSKVLPCQHTFCRRCLEEIVSTKNELRCPECRTIVTIKVEDLPPNILLIRLLEGIKTQGQLHGQTTTTETPSSRTDSPGVPNTISQPRQQRQNAPCAKALYNYEAKESGDLSFKKNDVVILRKQIDDNWFHGELNGQHGFFPVNYVQVLVALPQLPQCQALYDFDLKDEKEKDCLSFQKDETLTVIRRVDENWIEGRKGDKIGIFPVTFVKLNDAAKSLLNSKPSVSILQASNNTQSGGRNSDSSERTTSASETHRVTSPSVTSVNPALLASHPTSQPKRHSFTLAPQKSPSPPTQHQRRSLELGSSSSSSGAFSIPSTSAGSVGGTSTPPLTAAATAAAAAVVTTTTSSSTSTPKSAPQTVQAGTESSSGSSTTTTGSAGGDNSVMPSGLTPVYVATYSYKPQKDDELELRKGDGYTVSEKCQDGWYKGQCLKTGSTGVFPGNYVQLYSGSHSSRASKAAITVPPPGYSSSSSSKSSCHVSASSQGPAHSTTTVHLPKRGSHSSSPSGGWSSSSLAAMHHSMSASTNITPPNVVLGATGESHHSHSGKDKKEKKEKHDKHDKHDKQFTKQHEALHKDPKEHKERKDKEKKSLVKRLASKSKKSKSPGDDGETSALLEGSVTHVRSGSYQSAESGAGASGDSSQHKKTGSFDSASPPPSKPSRPKPLAREKFRCIVPYPPQTDHELDLQCGDIVFVHKKREDGWFKGTLSNSKAGLFPGSFVEKCE